MKNENLITIPLDELSVGDKVAIQANKTFGYYYFCEGFSFKTIEKITPKRTKIIFTDGAECNTRREVFFKINDYIMDSERQARKKIKLYTLIHMYEYYDSNRLDRGIKRNVLNLTEKELDRYIDIFTASKKAYEEIKGKEV